MAIKGVNLREIEEYILRADPGHEEHADYLAALKTDKEPEKPTVFMLGNLTAGQRVEIGDMSATPTMKEGAITMNMRRMHKVYQVVRWGLKGWDNFPAHDGAILTFEFETANDSGDFSKVAAEASLLHLSQADLAELSGAILEKNGMRSALEKKLEGASLALDEPLSLIGDAPTVMKEPKPKEGAKRKRSSQSEE